MARRLLRIAALTASLGVLTLAPAASTPAARPSAPASTWNVVASLPQALYGAAAAADPLYFAYLFGGYSTETGFAVDTAYRWNSVNERWEERAPMADAVEGASAVYVPSDTDPRIYVFGGVDPSTDTTSTATRIYDVFANSWSTGSGPACSAIVHGFGLRRGERQDLPRRRLQRDARRPGDDLGVQPRFEHVRGEERDPARGGRRRRR